MIRADSTLQAAPCSPCALHPGFARSVVEVQALWSVALPVLDLLVLLQVFSV